MELLHRVNRQKLCRAAAKCFNEETAVSSPSGEAWAPASPVYPLLVLMEALPKESRATVLEAVSDGDLDPKEATVLFIACHEACHRSRIHRQNFLSCWVDSLGGDCWGIDFYTTAGSGYAVNIASEGYGDAARYSILGMWRPAEDELARSACVKAAYAAHWNEFYLPPKLGEFARGLQPLWLECLEEVLRQCPWHWETIACQMPHEEEIRPGRVEFVRSVTGLRKERVAEMYREAGIRIRPAPEETDAPPAGKNAAAHRKRGRRRRHPDETAEEDGPGYRLLAHAAPFDPDSARFLLANYCYALEHISSSQRATDVD